VYIKYLQSYCIIARRWGKYFAFTWFAPWSELSFWFVACVLHCCSDCFERESVAWSKNWQRLAVLKFVKIIIQDHLFFFQTWTTSMKFMIAFSSVA